MQAKTFVGKLRVRIGEYENDVTLLIVANSREAAWDELEYAAQCYYGDDDTPEEDGGYYANGGEILTMAKSLEEIGLGTFLDLKPLFRVCRQANVTPPDETALEAPLSELAQSLTTALNRKSKVVSHSQVLNAIAAAYGHNNWHVLKNKLAGLEAASVSDKETPAPKVHIEPEQGLGAEHDAWVAREFERVGMDSVRFIEAQGYRIRENGTGHGWYALLPGETEFYDDGVRQSYLGYFSSLDDLVAEMLEDLQFIPDDVALALCRAHKLSVLKHKNPVLSSVWFSLEAEGSFATAGEAARAALAAKGIHHRTPLDYQALGLDARRRYIAEILFDEHTFDSDVEGLNGWEDEKEDLVQRAVFLDQGRGKPTRQVLYRVTFKRNSTEVDGISISA